MKIHARLRARLVNARDDDVLTVVLKFKRQGTEFASHSPSNDPNNPRLLAFAELVDQALLALGERRNRVRVVQLAANLGMAAVETPASVVQQILDPERMEAARLAGEWGNLSLPTPIEPTKEPTKNKPPEEGAGLRRTRR